MIHHPIFSFFFFFNDTATTEIYTLSLHDALPISIVIPESGLEDDPTIPVILAETTENRNPNKTINTAPSRFMRNVRSEEHTSELQSRLHLVCRLLLEKKKKTAK